MSSAKKKERKMSELTTIMQSQLKAELQRGQSKDKEFILYHSHEVEQMLLPEASHFLAVKTYFRMLGIPLKREARQNAEFLSSTGFRTKLPVLRVGNVLAAEFQEIVAYMESEGHSLWRDPVDPKNRQYWNAALLDMDGCFTNAELYLCWIDRDVRESITYQKYGCPYEWPLNRIQCWRKFKEVRRVLEVNEMMDFTLEHVAADFKLKCRLLSEKLGDNLFFNGVYPTEFDAIIFGHLFAILTIDLKNQVFAEEINKLDNLVNFCKNIDSTYFSRKSSTVPSVSGIKGEGNLKGALVKSTSKDSP